MDVLDSKTNKELMESVLAEIAKAKNEINCAKGDLTKAQSRLNFLVVVANKLIDRTGD
jgi:hypothetical protein